MHPAALGKHGTCSTEDEEPTAPLSNLKIASVARFTRRSSGICSPHSIRILKAVHVHKRPTPVTFSWQCMQCEWRSHENLVKFVQEHHEGFTMLEQNVMRTTTSTEEEHESAHSVLGGRRRRHLCQRHARADAERQNRLALEL